MPPGNDDISAEELKRAIESQVDPKKPDQTSKIHLREPIFECAQAVFVDSFLPHANITIYPVTIDGRRIGPPIGGPMEPSDGYKGFGTVPLKRPLKAGQYVYATQTPPHGAESLQSNTVRVVGRTEPLRPPDVLPITQPREERPTRQSKSPYYDCGQVVLAYNIDPSTRIRVYESKGTSRPKLNDLSELNLIGEVDTTGQLRDDKNIVFEPVTTTPLTAGHWIAVMQVSCPDTDHEVRTALSDPVQVKPAPSPMTNPDIPHDSVIPGNDYLVVEGLDIGAVISIENTIPVTHEVTTSLRLANQPVNTVPLSERIPPERIPPLCNYDTWQTLCISSPKSPGVSSTALFPAPTIVSDICFLSDEFSTVTVQGGIGTIFVFREVVGPQPYEVVGSAGAGQGDCEITLKIVQVNDPIFAVNAILDGRTVLNMSAPSNVVHVVDCGNVVTQHNDNWRSGAYLHETQLTPQNVKDNFGELCHRIVQGDIYAQPLYVRGVRTAKGLKNLVFVATSQNWVYAFDADDTNQASPGIVWPPRQLGIARILTNDDICAETIGSVGITSTPVIDVHTQTMYVVARTEKHPIERHPDNDGDTYLHALNIADGKDRPGSPVLITGISDPRNDGVKFKTNLPAGQRNRPGLLLLNGVVYIGFGAFGCDNRPYQGWVLGYRTQDLKLVAVFCTTINQVGTDPVTGESLEASGEGTGVWQSGNGLVGFNDGTIYFETGNDFGDKKSQLGNSFVRLQVIDKWPGLVLAGYFKPSNAPDLRHGDVDLGAGGPMLLPYGRLIGGGKQGRYYVLDQNTMQLTQDNGREIVTTPDGNQHNLGEGFQAFENTYHPEVKVFEYALTEPAGPNIHGGPVYWNGYIYKMPEKDYLKAFRHDLNTGIVEYTPVAGVAGNKVQPAATSEDPTIEDPLHEHPYKASDGMPGGFSSISANGDQNGIVWTVYHEITFSDPFFRASGILVAFDATPSSAAQLPALWNSRSSSEFTMAKFCPPTIADGKVYLATFARPDDVPVIFSPPPNPPWDVIGVDKNKLDNQTYKSKLIVFGLKPPLRPHIGRLHVRETIEDAIDRKHLEYGGNNGLLGWPTGAPVEIQDTQHGRFRHFRQLIPGHYKPRISIRFGVRANAPTFHRPKQGRPIEIESSIYWTQETGARVIWGEIREKWLQLGSQASELGYPISDETDTPDGKGRMSRFQHGEIWWYPESGAEVHLGRKTPEDK